MLYTELDLQQFSRQQKGRENLYTVKDLMKYFCNFIVIYVCAEIVSVYSEILNLCLLVSSAGNLCKQFGPRSGPTKCQA